MSPTLHQQRMYKSVFERNTQPVARVCFELDFELDSADEGNPLYRSALVSSVPFVTQTRTQQFGPLSPLPGYVHSFVVIPKGVQQHLRLEQSHGRGSTFYLNVF